MYLFKKNVKMETLNLDNKPYLIEAERKIGKNVIKTQASLLGYTEGITEHYWTNMKDATVVSSETKEVFDHSKRSFIPFGWTSLWAVTYPAPKKVSGRVVRDANNQIVFSEKTYKSKKAITVFGVWTDEKGNAPTTPQQLVSIDFKTFSASDLERLLASKCGKWVNGFPVTAPLLRIKITGAIPEGETQKLTFSVTTSDDFTFEYLVNSWLNDIISTKTNESNTPIYNANALQNIAPHNTSLNAMDFKTNDVYCFYPPNHAFRDLMPSKIERIDLGNGDFTLSLNYNGANKALELGSYVEEEESSFDMQMLGN